MGQIKTKWLQHDQITNNSWTETDIKASALFYQDVHPYLETKDGDFAKRIIHARSSAGNPEIQKKNREMTAQKE